MLIASGNMFDNCQKNLPVSLGIASIRCFYKNAIQFKNIKYTIIQLHFRDFYVHYY